MAKKETVVEETEKKVKRTRKTSQETIPEEVSEPEEESRSRVGLMLIIGVVVLLGVLLVVSIVQTNERSKYYNEITFTEFREIYDKEELSVVYWARPGCYYCQQFKPTVTSVSGKYQVTFNYLNTDNLGAEEYTFMYESAFIPYDDKYSTYTEENGTGVGTPAVMVVSKGKIVAMSIGAISEDQLVAFLQTNGIIAGGTQTENQGE